MCVRHLVVDTKLGEITVVPDGEEVSGSYVAEHARRPAA